MTTLWGYSIPETRSIDYDKNDKAFIAYLAQNAPSSKLCIGCGGMYCNLYGRQSDGLQHPEASNAGKAGRKRRSQDQIAKMHALREMPAGMSQGRRYPENDTDHDRLYKK